MKKILITGSTGFVGKRYLVYSKDRYELYPFSITVNMPGKEKLAYIDTVIHLGGLAHQMRKVAPQKYFDANFIKTKQLADIAKVSGVSHFIFVSTIKVFGESQNLVLTEQSRCLPENDPYGESKLKAEEYLKMISDSNFTVSIIRPPLIYGPGVKGNLDKLLKLCDSGYLLPFGSIHNRRTMIYLDNFIELINHIIDNKIGGLFLAGDSRPISMEELVTEIRRNLGRRVNLFSVPIFVRDLIKKIKPGLSMRLFGSLEMDTIASNNKLHFYPPYSIKEGIKSMVDYYIQHKNKGNP